MPIHVELKPDKTPTPLPVSNELTKTATVPVVKSPDSEGKEAADFMRMRTPNGTLVIGAGVTVLVMWQNPNRKFAAIINAGAANPVSLTGMTPGGANQGVTLFPNGGVWTFGKNTDMDYRGPVYAFSTAGTTISFIEQ